MYDRMRQREQTQCFEKYKAEEIKPETRENSHRLLLALGDDQPHVWVPGMRAYSSTYVGD